jgi:hypothetical protein
MIDPIDDDMKLTGVLAIEKPANLVSSIMDI